MGSRRHGETVAPVHCHKEITEVIGDFMPSRHTMKCDPAQVGRQILSVGGVKWAKRIMALTKSEVCFSKVGSDLKVDYIPCDEIISIEGLKNSTDRTGTRASAPEDKQASARLSHRASLTHSMINMNEFKTVNLKKTLSKSNSNESLSSAPSDLVVPSEIENDFVQSGMGLQRVPSLQQSPPKTTSQSSLTR